MKQTFQWIMKNTLEKRIIIGDGIGPYFIYFAQRKPLTMPYKISPKINQSYMPRSIVLM